jgi:uncharacterized membrane protein (UPF0127 family)
MTLRRGRFVLITAGLLLFAACGSDASEPSVDPTSQPPTVPSQLESFSLDVIDVENRPWLVAVADTGELRAQGLMGVTDLEDLDGMLFVFEDDTTARFHMQDTLIPLDIAFFTVDGALVSIHQMVPCLEAPCARYSADGPYRYALEAQKGALIDLPGDAVLDLESE